MSNFEKVLNYSVMSFGSVPEESSHNREAILEAHREAVAKSKKEGFNIGYKAAGGDVIPLEIVELTPTAEGE